MEYQALWGIAIVQDTQDAAYASMPQNVQQYIEVDHVAPAAELGAIISSLVVQATPRRPNLTKEDMELLKMEVIVAARDNAFAIGILEKGEF